VYKKRGAVAPPIFSKVKRSKIRRYFLLLRGFTLLELIVTVAILSLGIVFIYEGFFVSLGVSSYTKNYLDVQLWIEQKLWDIQDKLLRYKTLLTQQSSGSFILRNKNFLWELSYALIEGTEKINLYEIDLRVRWKEGLRNVEIVRATYAKYVKD
jgi:prepilin-type N-terminal cleavage/methylation domain-containing protein